MRLDKHLAPAELRLALLLCVMTGLSLVWGAVGRQSPAVQAWLDEPWPEDTLTAPKPFPEPAPPPQPKSVDINSCEQGALIALPGIGPALAGRILEYRRTHGPYKSVQDLLNIKGIGSTTLEKYVPI